MNEDSPLDCVIIGAGISGLMAAKILSESGLEVTVLEKSRGLGGRMATRRFEGGVFDHGAQFFTVRDPRFQEWVSRWEEHGLVTPWYEMDSQGTHFRADPSMNAIGKHLAQELVVGRDVVATEVSYNEVDALWIVETKDGDNYQSRALVLTAPVPQSLALLDAGRVKIAHSERAALEAITYHRCIVAMATLDRPSSIESHGGSVKLTGEPIQWIADNQKKGVSPACPCATIHSTPAFAEEHWDTPNPERIPLLLEAADPHLKAKVTAFDGHRWGYSQPTTSFHEEAFVDPTIRLAIAGDGPAGGRVEGAAISGLFAAEKLISILSP